MIQTEVSIVAKNYKPAQNLNGLGQSVKGRRDLYRYAKRRSRQMKFPRSVIHVKFGPANCLNPKKYELSSRNSGE